MSVRGARLSSGFAVVVAVVVAAPVAAQPTVTLEGEPPERPKIGLVLSGGGARGGAHLGVIKALEELRVPIDYIAGTSIGAAVGGIYASGLSVAEVEAFLASIDWDAAFGNVTPRQLRSFRRKRDDDLYLVSQKPGLNNGELQIPVGLVQGQVIDMTMSRVVFPVAHIEDFDDLAIPFRAVAGDIATGEAVVLESGDLARAIRASMAVPAALSPMVIDGRLLVDGGIVMNLPVEVAQSMGADVIVAVDITDRLASQDEIRSIVQVTEQLTNLLTRTGTVQQTALLTDRDFLLRPEIPSELSSVNFARINETIEYGYSAVMERRASAHGPGGGGSIGLQSPPMPAHSGAQTSHAAQRPAPQPAAAPQAPAPRIKPRGNAMATPNASDGKSAATTVVFMIVALGVGVAIGGLAFGLF